MKAQVLQKCGLMLFPPPVFPCKLKVRKAGLASPIIYADFLLLAIGLV